MQRAELLRRRLANQRLAGGLFKDPVDAVTQLGALQAQDFYGALWGVGQRVPTTTEREVERYFTDGRILRLHILRPTWHFVSPADVRWMLKLTSHRVHSISGTMYRQLGIDAPTVKKTFKIIEKALRGGNTLTRNELGALLDSGGVRIGEGDGMRLGYLMFHAELEALVTSGPRRGKQFTYGLLDDRAATPAKSPSGQDALAELARRYFVTRGPATAKDFSWWSGLTITQAKASIKLLDSELQHEVVNDADYYWSDVRKPAASLKGAFLLPNYDEYGIGFVDRSAIYDAEQAEQMKLRDRPIFGHLLMVDGRGAGTWRRELGKGEVTISYSYFKPVNATAKAGIAKAAKRYADFLGLKLKVAK
jgi:hypothetical protein